MKWSSFPQPIAITVRIRRCAALVSVVVAALTLAVWLSGGTPAESSHSPAAAPQLVELTPPRPLVNAAEDDPDTAFPENQAGFSAYYEVDSQDDTEPRLNIAAITVELLGDPDESDPDRTKPGTIAIVDGEEKLGANFAIVILPMVAAIGPGSLVRNVTVYYDDQGWIVAYLPKDIPAAAAWRYDSKYPDDLEQNLLVLAINEVLKAAGRPAVSHDTVGYYDWQNPDCNAFVLFSHQTKGGASEPINFVVPPKITEIDASAAVLITTYPSEGENVSATVAVDKQEVVADASNRLKVGEIRIDRETDDDGKYKTGLYAMTVTVNDGHAATGVVMLLYKKPASS